MKIIPLLALTSFSAVTSFHVSALPGITAEPKDSAIFQHLAPEFKENTCKNVSCYEVTQAAGVAANFDTGVYKIYKTKRELENTQATLESNRSVLKGYELLDSRDRDPVRRAYYIPKVKTEIKQLENQVSALQKDLDNDLLKASQIYGVSPENVHIIDEENQNAGSVLFGGDRGGFALIFKKEENGKVTYIVSLKGTEKSSANDILSDLDSDPVELEQGDKGRYSSVETSDVIVPKGFRQYAKSVIDDREGQSFSLIQDVTKLQQENKKVEVVVTGHSLGGASSVIYSAMLQNRGIKPENIKIITFAAPPAANQQQFVNRYGKLGSNMTRVQDYGDAVIDLPINTDPKNIPNIPFLGDKAKKVINDYHTYYVDGSETPFLYGEILAGPKVGETLNDKVDRLKNFRARLEGVRDDQFWNNPSLISEFAELGFLIKQEGLLQDNIFLAEFSGKATLNIVLNTLMSSKNSGKISVSQIQELYSATIDILRLKKLGEKGEVHIGYKDYYQYGSQFISPFQVDKKKNSSNSGTEMLVYNSCMAQVSSSHIGSASCSFKVPDQPIQTESQAQNFASRGIGESTQQANQYTNGQIVKVPLDIGLTWNQNTKLDLDSHLVTPNGEHVYFLNRGKLDGAPNAFLYRDSIPNGGLKGAEQTRITQFQDGEYRFYVYNYSEGGTQGYTSNSLSNSGATVKLYEGGAPLTNIPNDPAIFNLNDPNVQNVGSPYPGNSTLNIPTNQSGNTWYVFRLDTRTGILTRVDRLGNAPSSTGVPNVR
jgi:Lipase (class 3)